MEYLTTTQIAEKWNISRRRVAKLCAEGRIDGAKLMGKTWWVPDDAEKPEDQRLKGKCNGQ
ncbi:MAG: helix-turn-helix domain-containing protein [Hornefia butyriciproducens]|uniref:helix-turn-helix domain-containing protein n=1 Tax=Hornefia butyriciproducens TaxID=2652293 RepID=UPI002A765124|nr:helix-turn-helix domain-containing protein [Hornefia butyriciproducens]MCI7327635.1 helix-turn-helix domain-containing protein [Clostridiales bacterium]MDY2990536.1 helix-turn-helix domain-containing protein [Hornefia butyriciproducens]